MSIAAKREQANLILNETEKQNESTAIGKMGHEIVTVKDRRTDAGFSHFLPSIKQ